MREPLSPFQLVFQVEGGDGARSHCNFIVRLLFARVRETAQRAIDAERALVTRFR